MKKKITKFFKNMKEEEVVTIIGILLGILIITCMFSCTVTRTITNESKYLQDGDTSVVIQTKTTEKYNATKK